MYRWQPNAFVYLQLWEEFTGSGKPKPLVAFDESGEVRILYPTYRDQSSTHVRAGESHDVPRVVARYLETYRPYGRSG